MSIIAVTCPAVTGSDPDVDPPEDLEEVRRIMRSEV